MVRVLVSDTIDRESAKHAALMRKSKDWLARIRVMCASGAISVYPRTIVSVSTS
jgi:hypothetical protein